MSDAQERLIRSIVPDNAVSDLYIFTLNKLRADGFNDLPMLRSGQKLVGDDVLASYVASEKRIRGLITADIIENAKKGTHALSIFYMLLVGERVTLFSPTAISVFNHVFWDFTLTSMFMLLNANIDWTGDTLLTYRSILSPLVRSLFKVVLHDIINDNAKARAIIADHSLGKIFNAPVFSPLFVSESDPRYRLQKYRSLDAHLPPLPMMKIVPHYAQVNLQEHAHGELNFSEDVVLQLCVLMKSFPRISSFALSEQYIRQSNSLGVVGSFYDALAAFRPSTRGENNNFSSFSHFIELEYFKYWIIILNAFKKTRSVPILLRKSKFIETYYPTYFAAEHYYLQMIQTREKDAHHLFHSGLPYFFLDDAQRALLAETPNTDTWTWVVDMLHHSPHKKTFYDGWPDFHLRYSRSYKQYLPEAISLLETVDATAKNKEKQIARIEAQYDFTYDGWLESRSDVNPEVSERAFLHESFDVAFETIENETRTFTGKEYDPIFSSHPRMFEVWADSLLNYIEQNPLETGSREFRIITQHVEFNYHTWQIEDSSQFYLQFLFNYYPGFLLCYYNDFDATNAKKKFFFDAVSSYVRTSAANNPHFLSFANYLDRVRDLDQVHFNEDLVESVKKEVSRKVKQIVNDLAVLPVDSAERIAVENEHKRLEKISLKLSFLLEDAGMRDDDFPKGKAGRVLDKSLVSFLFRLQANLFGSNQYHFRFQRKEIPLVFTAVNKFLVERNANERFADFLIRKGMQANYNVFLRNVDVSLMFNEPCTYFNPSPYLEWIMWSFEGQRAVLPMLTEYKTEEIRDALAVRKKGKALEVIIDPSITRNVVFELLTFGKTTSSNVFYRHLPTSSTDVSAFKINFNTILLFLHQQHVRIQPIDKSDESVEVEMKFLADAYKAYLEKTSMSKEMKSTLPSVVRRDFSRQKYLWEEVDNNISNVHVLEIAKQRELDWEGMRRLENNASYIARNIRHLQNMIDAIQTRYREYYNIPAKSKTEVEKRYKVFFIHVFDYVDNLIGYWYTKMEEKYPTHARIGEMYTRMTRVRIVLQFIIYKLVVRENAIIKMRPFLRTDLIAAYEEQAVNFDAAMREVVEQVIREREENAGSSTRNYVNDQKSFFLHYLNAVHLYPFLKMLPDMYVADLFDGLEGAIGNAVIGMFNDNSSPESVFVNFPPPEIDSFAPMKPDDVPDDRPYMPTREDIQQLGALMALSENELAAGINQFNARVAQDVREQSEEIFNESFSEEAEREQQNFDLQALPVVLHEDVMEEALVPDQSAVTNELPLEEDLGRFVFVDQDGQNPPDLGGFTALQGNEVPEPEEPPLFASLEPPSEEDVLFATPPIDVQHAPAPLQQEEIVLPRKRPYVDVFGYMDSTVDKNKEARIGAILRQQKGIRLLEYNADHPPQLLIAAYHPQWYENMSPAMKDVFHAHPTVPVVLVSDFHVSAPLHKDLRTFRVPEVWVC